MPDIEGHNALEKLMAPTSAAPEAQKKSALPMVALGVSSVSLCLGCLWPVGLILAIVAMIQTGKPEHAAGRGKAVAALIVSGVGFFMLGLMAAIAIPNFMKFQGRSKQSECKLNLNSLKLSARLRMMDEQPVTSFEDLDFNPGPSNRYAYVMSPPDGRIPVGAAHPQLSPEQIQTALGAAGVEPGVKGECPDCTVTFACVGNVDMDDTLDVWSVTVGGADAGDAQVVHVVNDLE
jgi:type II secretory pathway pseudopilin PulG